MDRRSRTLARQCVLGIAACTGPHGWQVARAETDVGSCAAARAQESPEVVEFSCSRWAEESSDFVCCQVAGGSYVVGHGFIYGWGLYGCIDDDIRAMMRQAYASCVVDRHMGLQKLRFLVLSIPCRLEEGDLV